ncbi:predicted protein [Chaetoceros tenuissimus]|uniref:C6H2-type domain-containing protein n=1 Tax=Chaetoceros tenuissimus TaxID=426638 RepID=A0AAD3D3Q9_9STRA|nr:predicted protein [Chaetoceros tenuissimus]
MECFKVTCSKCGKEENQDCKFKVCPICKKLNMDPYPYCCQECFKVDWKTHKTKHARFSKESEERSLEVTSTQLQLARCKETSKKMVKLHVAMKSRKFNTASRICRKGVIKNPLDPHWFLCQSRIELDQNKNGEKASQLLEQGVECFFHIIWEKPIRSQDILVITGIISLFVEIMHIGPVFTADWILNDKKFMAIWKLLKIITYDLIDEKTEDKDEVVSNCFLLYKVEFFNILLHTGKIHKGCIDNTSEKRSYHDFALATNSFHIIVVLFENCVQLCRDCQQSFLEINFSSALAQAISRDEQKISPFHDGEWVFAKDLSTNTGKLLNKHPGLVEGDSLNAEGRVAVRFKKNGPLKYLRPENLESARKTEGNKMAAVLMFKPISYQWKFAEYDLQCS